MKKYLLALLVVFVLVVVAALAWGSPVLGMELREGLRVDLPAVATPLPYPLPLIRIGGEEWQELGTYRQYEIWLADGGVTPLPPIPYP